MTPKEKAKSDKTQTIVTQKMGFWGQSDHVRYEVTSIESIDKTLQDIKTQLIHVVNKLEKL